MLDYGVQPRDFWEMSLDEVLDFLESYSRKEERREKEELRKIHFLARDMAHQVGFVMAGNENDAPPELWNYFPELFAAEKAYAEKKKKERAVATYKARMMDFMYRHNHVWTGGEK